MEAIKKEIEQKIRERKLLGKEVVTEEEKERQHKHLFHSLENEKVKFTNKITSCKHETERLSEIITNLGKEKEKYGVEASQANAKYY